MMSNARMSEDVLPDAVTNFEHKSHKRLLVHEKSIFDSNKKQILVCFKIMHLFSFHFKFTFRIDCHYSIIYTKGGDNECSQEEAKSSNRDLILVDDQGDKQANDDIAAEYSTTDADWGDVCKKIKNDPVDTPYRENLETFLFGIQKMETSRATLQATYETVCVTLQSILESTLAAAIPIHELDCTIMSHTETELLQLFRYNHQHRKSILQSLNSHNQIWEGKYRNYVSRIVSTQSQSSVVETPVDVKNSVLPSIDVGQHDSTVKNEGCIDAEPQASDWEEMIQLNPSSQENVEAFLDGCDRWNTACNTLSCSFDEIRQTIEAHHTTILQIVESAYSRINDDMAEMQENIQDYIISNNRRRSHIEQSLEEIVQRQQSIFSRLLARVGVNIPIPWKHNTTD